MKTSVPNVVLRLEGLAVFTAAAVVYARLDFRWLGFAVGFFLPDLFVVGYLAGNKIGAAGYNLVHTYVGPLALAVLLLALKRPELLSVPLVWSAHIGFDRFLGYGLKYATGFKSTHLQKV